MRQPDEVVALKSRINARSFEIYRRAFECSCEKIEQCQTAVAGFLEKNDLDPTSLCVVAVGSVGRLEALAASDLDVIPVMSRPGVLSKEQDRALRDAIRNATRIKVSAGEELTRFVSLEELVADEHIGGDHDSPDVLTRRILILSEGIPAGGALDLQEIRRKILHAYANKERTSGRHVLSLCNDLARYYRRLFIDYKAKVEFTSKDWCTRNLKLRHSRKLWYFSTILAIAACSCSQARDDSSYREALLAIFGRPPYARLLEATPAQLTAMAEEILESFAWFLDFMSHEQNREALAAVTHSERYNVSLTNPFPAMKHNSDLLHRAMLNLLDSLDRPIRQRVLDWFLL